MQPLILAVKWIAEIGTIFHLVANSTNGQAQYLICGFFFFFSTKVTYSIHYPHFCKQHENFFVIVKKALKTHL